MEFAPVRRQQIGFLVGGSAARLAIVAITLTIA
jgi:hypothetical protein